MQTRRACKIVYFCLLGSLRKKKFSMMPGCPSAGFTLTVCFTTLFLITLADPSSMIHHTLIGKLLHLSWQGMKFGAFEFDSSHRSVVMLGDLFRLTSNLILILYIDSHSHSWLLMHFKCVQICVCMSAHMYIHSEEVSFPKFKRFIYLESFKKEIHVQNLKISIHCRWTNTLGWLGTYQ